MKKEFFPYYLSRAFLSLLFAILIAGVNWKALLIAAITFGFFLLYLHSGWFQIDTGNPLFPIRRDTRGELVQRKALIFAVLAGILAYVLLPFLSPSSRSIGQIAFACAIIVYFSSQFLLFSKA